MRTARNLPRRIRNGIRRKVGRKRLLLKHPPLRHQTTDAAILINELSKIQKDLHRNYLEIGVQDGFTLEAICSKQKTGVDPSPRFDHQNLPKGTSFFPSTSDQFFKSESGSTSWSIIFVDGLHTFQQAYTDLRNAIRVLDQTGVIVLDDTVPDDEIAAIPDQRTSLSERNRRGLTGRRWQGDVFKVVLALDFLNCGLEYFTIQYPTSYRTLIWRPKDVSLPPYLEVRHIGEITFQQTFGAEPFPNLPPNFKSETAEVVFDKYKYWLATQRVSS